MKDEEQVGKLYQFEQGVIDNPYKDFEIGHVFRNFSELLEPTGIKPATSTPQKQRQLKEVEKFISLERKGNKWIITKMFQEEIYNFPYSNETYLPLLKMMADNKKRGSINMFYSEFNRAIGLYNQNYTDFAINNRWIYLAEFIEIDKEIMEEVMNSIKYFSNPKRRDKEKEAATEIEKQISKFGAEVLRELQTQRIITSIKFGYRGKFHNRKYKMSISNPDHPLYAENRDVMEMIDFAVDEVRELTDSEERSLIRMERTVAEEMGFYDMREIFCSPARYRSWKKLVSERLFDEIGLIFHAQSITINYLGDKAETLLNSFIKEIDKESLEIYVKKMLKDLKKRKRAKELHEQVDSAVDIVVDKNAPRLWSTVEKKVGRSK